MVSFRPPGKRRRGGCASDAIRARGAAISAKYVQYESNRSLDCLANIFLCFRDVLESSDSDCPQRYDLQNLKARYLEYMISNLIRK